MIRGFILTGSKHQYHYFLKSNDLNRLEFPMLTSMEQLQGLQNPIILKMGTYYLSPIFRIVEEWELINHV